MDGCMEGVYEEAVAEANRQQVSQQSDLAEIEI